MKGEKARLILLSGGKGTRAQGSVPKQYAKKDGRMMVTQTFGTFAVNPLIDGAQVVMDPIYKEEFAKELKEVPLGCGEEFPVGYSLPGETRQLSIWNALKDLEGVLDEDSLIIIHDAARPYVSKDLIERVVTGAFGYGGCIPVLPVTDTVYGSSDGRKIDSLPDREKIFRGQAPESFRFGDYLRANKALFPERIYRIQGSTQPAFLHGMDVAMVFGDEENMKVTTGDDLERWLHHTLNRNSMTSPSFTT